MSLNQLTKNHNLRFKISHSFYLIFLENCQQTDDLKGSHACIVNI